MNVVFLDFSERWSGSSRVFAMWAQELGARGHQCTRVVLSGTELETVAVAARLSVPSSRYAGILARRVRKVLSGRIPDLVFVHSEREHLVAAKLASGSARVVRRIPAGGSFEEGRASKRVATRYLFTSESPPSGRAMKSGTPQAFRAELGAAVPETPAAVGTPDWILCIASREAVSRAAIVLRALAMLAQRRVALRVVVAGTAAADADLRILASALGLAKRIEWRPEAYLTLALNETPALAMVVGDGDDAALGVLDGMALGIPVISERTTVAARYLSHGIQGTLFAQLEPATLAAEAAVLLSDDGRRRVLGSAGRARVEREFALREMLASVERLQRDRATPVGT